MKLTLTTELLTKLGLPEDATEEQVESRMLEMATLAAAQPPASGPPAEPAQGPAPAEPAAEPAQPAASPFDREAVAAAFDGLRSAILGEPAPAAPAPVQMSAGEVDAIKRIAELESKVATREAEQRVERDLADNDQGVIPPSVRDSLRPHLIQMAAAGSDDSYKAVLSGVTRVKLAERGTAKASPLAGIELTDEERKICRDNGMELDEFRRAKAERLGIKIEER